MIRYCIELGYTPNPDKLIPKKDTNPKVESCVIAFCMHATGISRLFNKENVQEFLYRVAVIMRKYDVVGDFFKNDVIFAFKDNEVSYNINLIDLTEHLGIEI